MNETEFRTGAERLLDGEPPLAIDLPGLVQVGARRVRRRRLALAAPVLTALVLASAAGVQVLESPSAPDSLVAGPTAAPPPTPVLSPAPPPPSPGPAPVVEESPASALLRAAVPPGFRVVNSRQSAEGSTLVEVSLADAAGASVLGLELQRGSSAFRGRTCPAAECQVLSNVTGRRVELRQPERYHGFPYAAVVVLIDRGGWVGCTSRPTAARVARTGSGSGGGGRAPHRRPGAAPRRAGRGPALAPARVVSIQHRAGVACHACQVATPGLSWACAEPFACPLREEGMGRHRHGAARARQGSRGTGSTAIPRRRRRSTRPSPNGGHGSLQSMTLP